MNIQITDNGPPPGSAPAPDLVNFSPGDANRAAISCAPGALFPISQGNYVVHDQPVTDPLGLNVLNQFLTQIEQQANDPYG